MKHFEKWVKIQDVTREDIQNAAALIIRDEGYDKLTLALLSTKLGVKKSSIYYHYASKDEIICSLYETFREKLKGFSFTLDFSKDANSVLESLILHYEEIFFDEELSPYLSLISQRQGIDEQADELNDVLELMVEAQSEAVIANLSERGKLSLSNPKLLSELISSRILALIKNEKLEEVEALASEITLAFGH